MTVGSSMVLAKVGKPQAFELSTQPAQCLQETMTEVKTRLHGGRSSGLHGDIYDDPAGRGLLSSRNDAVLTNDRWQATIAQMSCFAGSKQATKAKAEFRPAK